MTAARPSWREVDWVLLGSALALALVGVAFIHSARSGDGQLGGSALRQAAYLVVALVVFGVTARIDYRRLASWAAWIYVPCLGLLAAVLVVGREAGGQKSWLPLPVIGLSVQPSELAKVGTLLMVAAVAGRREGGRLRFWDAATYGLVVGLPVLLILAQPDDGTALTFAPLLAGVVFVSGLRWRLILAAVVLLALATPLAWQQLKPYQQARMRIVLDPQLDPSGVGYHAIQSRIAVGSGGLLGQGYREGPQNRLGFLPERHTDYIFAVLAEEWGFVGSLLVLGLYVVLLRRMVEAAAVSSDRLGALLSLGVLAFFSVHLLVNVGMVLGVMPTIGIPLPLLSFGGTALVATFAMLGLVASVRLHRHAR